MAKVKIITTGIDKAKIKAAAIAAINDTATLEVQVKVKKFWRTMFGRILKNIVEGIVQEMLKQCDVGKVDFSIKFV